MTEHDSWSDLFRDVCVWQEKTGEFLPTAFGKIDDLTEARETFDAVKLGYEIGQHDA